MTTINNICHANKDIIRLTETLRTSLLTLANSIYIKVCNFGKRNYLISTLVKDQEKPIINVVFVKIVVVAK